MASRPQIPTETWEAHKEQIRLLFLVENVTLDDLPRRMRESTGFEASKAQYVRQLKKWNFGKNQDSQRWKYIARVYRERKAQGKQSVVIINGRLVPDAKVRKEMSRHDWPTLVLPGLKVTILKAPEGIRVCSPTTARSLLARNDAPSPPSNVVDVGIATSRDVGTAQEHNQGSLDAVGLKTLNLAKYVEKGNVSMLRYFLSQGLTAKTSDDPWGDKLLSTAVEGGRTDVLEELLKYRAGTNAPSSTWFTYRAIALAIERERGDMVRQLLHHGLRPNSLYLGVPPLLDLAFRSDKSGARVQLDVLQQLLLAGADPMLTLHPLLCLAVRADSYDAVVALLKAKANPNSRWENGKPPVQLAVESGNVQILEVLLAARGDANAKLLRSDAMCPTLLGIAAERGHLGAAKSLLKHGALADGLGNRYTTPLEAAVQGRCTDMVQLLLENGAQANVSTGHFHLPPLHLGISQRNRELLQMLIKNGADVNGHTDNIHDSPLVFAVRTGDPDIVRFLLENGADAKTYKPRHPTLLHEAIRGDNISMVQALLDYGADVNLDTNHWFGSPLKYALRQGSRAMVRYLLEHGAYVNRDRAALDFALVQNDDGLLQLLVDHGANITIDSHISAVWSKP